MDMSALKMLIFNVRVLPQLSKHANNADDTLQKGMRRHVNEENWQDQLNYNWHQH